MGAAISSPILLCDMGRAGNITTLALHNLLRQCLLARGQRESDVSGLISRLQGRRASPEAHGNRALGALRRLEHDGPVVPDTPIVPDIWFAADPEAPPAGRIRSRVGELLEAEFELAAPARWLALHLALGPANLSGCAGFGLAVQASAPRSLALRVCLRSGAPGGFVERFFPRELVIAPEGRLHVDILDLQGAAPVPPRAPWRDLILFLPPESCSLTLRAMRIFTL